jgi:hypothetical protein
MDTAVYFRLEGSFLTTTARDLVCEGAWEDGLRLLTRGLAEITTDQAVSVLSGDKRLAGTNEMDLVDEEPPARDKYLASLRFLFAGTVRTRDIRVLHWRPYARVTGWCRRDLPREFKWVNRWHRAACMPVSVQGWGQANIDWSLARCVFYMDDDRDDRAVFVNYAPGGKKAGAQATLWKLVDSPPIWWDCKSTWQEGVDEFLTTHASLEERGGHLLPPDPSDNDDRSLKIRAAIKAEKPPRVTETGLAPATDTMSDSLSGRQDWESPPVKGEVSQDFGWIARDGVFYVCRYFEHDALATRIVKHIFGQEANDAERFLDERGFIRVTVSQINHQPMLYIGVLRHPTEAQKKTTIEWCLAHNLAPSLVDFMAHEE